jgi:transposase
LRIANPSPPSGWVEDFHLQATEHARHTTSPRIAEAFGVREDTVRLWRCDFADGGVEALKASVAPGPAPVKSEAALRVVTPLLEAPVANRRNWTIARLISEIEAREGVRIGRSQLSKTLRKKTSAGGGRGTP